MPTRKWSMSRFKRAVRRTLRLSRRSSKCYRRWSNPRTWQSWYGVVSVGSVDNRQLHKLLLLKLIFALLQKNGHVWPQLNNAHGLRGAVSAVSRGKKRIYAVSIHAFATHRNGFEKPLRWYRTMGPRQLKRLTHFRCERFRNDKSVP